MKNYRSLTLLLTLFVLLLVSFTASCDKRNPPPIIPTPPEPVPESDILQITRMWASPDLIYADNNITYSEISVEVKNGEGFGVTGQTVNFKTDIGSIITTVSTDSTGIARTTFFDSGDSGNANITAEVRKYHPSISDSLLSSDKRTIQVMIAETPEISTLILDLPNIVPGVTYNMGVSTVVDISARAYLETGSPVPNNSLVTFECTKGRFLDNEDNDLGNEFVAKTRNGKATIKYDSGTQATNLPGAELAMVKAKIGAAEASHNINIRPGSPASINLKSFLNIGGVDVEASSTEVGSTHHIYIQAELSDMYNNKCNAKRVDMETDLGTFMNTTNQTRLTTDEYGLARVRFTPGLSAGAATIVASANNDTLQTQIIFTIGSDDVYSMDFTQEQAVSINVEGSGGQSSAILRVKLRDINYNLVDSPYEVTFKIVKEAGITPPAGANLNGELNDAGEPVAVTVMSNGGEAQVSVNAGTESGVLVIEAQCTSNSGNVIKTRKPNVLIHAGPPAHIAPFMEGFEQGESAGAGFWQIQVGAIVRDIYNNPVTNNTPVWFSIEQLLDPCYYTPESMGGVTIMGFATVGNANANEDTVDGTAYTEIVYPGSMINSLITIKATSGNATGYLDSKLPLIGSMVHLTTDPRTVNLGGTVSNKMADIIIYHTDGQGTPVKFSNFMIDGGLSQIIMNPNHISSPYNYGPGAPVENRIWTNTEGYAYSRCKVYLASLTPPPQPGDPPEENVIIITAWLMGDAQNEEVQTQLTAWCYTGTPPF
ncbi:MAG: hypothetical protein LHW60_04365 [Candidatus Cloacimonetes bacterium]|nr:hypothetical protein [Candidatus Cloacimonadota bacterium]NLO43792.1 hypothetical protein [Candidatus Cloacimonadota bacterium]